MTNLIGPANEGLPAVFGVVVGVLDGALDAMTVKGLSLGVVALLTLVAVAVGACAPLKVYNALAPSDAEGVLARSDIAYGDHIRHTLDVYVPAARPAAAPVVVVFYGGSWNSGSKADYAFLGKALASRGFVVAVADYRLVPEVRFPGFLEDGARAVAWAHRNARDFGGDPARLFLLGHSAGAYNAAMVALEGRYLQAHGVNTSIIRGVVGLAGPYDFLPLDVASTKEAFGRSTDLASTQPINFVTANAPPMFLATGGDDTTVKPRNTAALADRMKRAGRPVRVRTYPGVSHIGIMLALSVPFRSNAPVLDDVAQFIAGT
jgi:acetyl esterase/lipase